MARIPSRPKMAVIGLLAALSLQVCHGFSASLESCQTDLHVKSNGLIQMDNKGMAVDDQSLFDCVDSMPQKWPNTNEPIKSIRIFKSYKRGQSKHSVARTRKRLVEHVKANRMKVLVGSQITCDHRDDEEDWQYTRELLKELGADHILGLAVGNELDQLQHHSNVSSHCLAKIFGRLHDETVRRISEARELTGYKTMPVTSVFSGEVLWSQDVPKRMEARKYLKRMVREESNYVFTWNLYPIFDLSNQMDKDGKHCHDAVRRSSCFTEEGCLTQVQVIKAWSVMGEIMQAAPEGSRIRWWVGEIGWSAPKPSMLSSPVADCRDFTSYRMLHDFYTNFLAWDHNASGAEHAFYFTFRDSDNFGNKEHFGLVENCGSKKCKLTKARLHRDSQLGSEPSSTGVTAYV